MAETLLQVPVNGAIEEIAKVVQAIAGYHNGYAADDSSQFPSAPRYDGPSFMVDYTRATAGPTGRFIAGGTNHLTLTNTGATSALNWTVGGLTASSLSVGGNATVGGTLAVTGAATLSSTLTVGGALTANSSLTVAGALTANGNTTIGSDAGDTLTVNATASFLGPVTFVNLTLSGNLTVNGNTTLGNAAADLLVVTATSTFLSPLKVTDAATKIPLYVDPSNNRTIVGSDTAMGSDTTPALHNIGRAYFAPESANDLAIQIRRVSSATVGWNIGMTSTADLVFKDDATAETFRVGDTASTYQMLTTGAGRVTGNFFADRQVIGATAFSSTESLRVNGATRLESGLTVTAGGANITGSAVFSTTVSLTTGNVVAVTGALIANNNALFGTEKLRVSGTGRIEGNLTITTGGLTVTGTTTFNSSFSVTGGPFIDAGSSNFITIANPATAAGKVFDTFVQLNVGGGTRWIAVYT